MPATEVPLLKSKRASLEVSAEKTSVCLEHESGLEEPSIMIEISEAPSRAEEAGENKTDAESGPACEAVTSDQLRRFFSTFSLLQERQKRE